MHPALPAASLSRTDVETVEGQPERGDEPSKAWAKEIGVHVRNSEKPGSWSLREQLPDAVADLSSMPAALDRVRKTTRFRQARYLLYSEDATTLVASHHRHQKPLRGCSALCDLINSVSRWKSKQAIHRAVVYSRRHVSKSMYFVPTCPTSHPHRITPRDGRTRQSQEKSDLVTSGPPPILHTLALSGSESLLRCDWAAQSAQCWNERSMLMKRDRSVCPTSQASIVQGSLLQC